MIFKLSGMYAPKSTPRLIIKLFGIISEWFQLPWWLRWWRICPKWGRPGFDPWVGKIPWRKAWQSTPVFLPGESPWTQEPGGHRPRGCKESDMTKHKHREMALCFLLFLFFCIVKLHMTLLIRSYKYLKLYFIVRIYSW